ncbi:hypothetical protein [Marinilabilia salmonicolor]|uniref:hypothetical protein n=1 Tax=Marinilabilia salmonicolor TaxID=989 RepID=UPI0015E7148F|nr:hypothetical protein [Marinilabilia salmonicolor]
MTAYKPYTLRRVTHQGTQHIKYCNASTPSLKSIIFPDEQITIFKKRLLPELYF